MAESSDGYNAKVIGEFRANSGRVGGMWEETPLLLLHHTGALSGVSRVNPAAYLPDDGRYLIWAANGGAPNHPAWYHNLKEHPLTRIEVSSETIDVAAQEATSDERDRLFARAAKRYPQLADIAGDRAQYPPDGPHAQTELLEFRAAAHSRHFGICPGGGCRSVPLSPHLRAPVAGVRRSLLERLLAPECVLKPQEEGGENEYDANVCYEPCPKVVFEEQDVNTDHDAYKSKHINHDGYVSSHAPILLSPDSQRMPLTPSRASWGSATHKRPLSRRRGHPLNAKWDSLCSCSS